MRVCPGAPHRPSVLEILSQPVQREVDGSLTLARRWSARVCPGMLCRPPRSPPGRLERGRPGVRVARRPRAGRAARQRAAARRAGRGRGGPPLLRTHGWLAGRAVRSGPVFVADESPPCPSCSSPSLSRVMFKLLGRWRLESRDWAARVTQSNRCGLCRASTCR